ncbi:MAG: MobP3 family relaxase [Eubacteriales bacterium]
MARLVIKNSYIKSGKSTTHATNLVKYIATRDGVEKIRNGNQPKTSNQKSFIQKLLRDFPDSKHSHEYQDYLDNPTRENASEFIETTLEQQAHTLLDSEKYLDYIANRPRVEIVDGHGLFSSYGSGKLELAKISRELADHKGNIWTPIISLKREDAERMACNSAEQWKALLNAEVMSIAESFKIHPDNFKWYAAFHNESHHPHVHFVCYSTREREGFLTKEGIEKMKSTLTNAIFKEELLPLYNLKTEHRDQLKKEAKESLRTLMSEVKLDMTSPKIELLMGKLSQELRATKGKKQYGYLPPRLKNLVDKIVDQLGAIPEVERAYDLWWESKTKIDLTYSDDFREKPPLSKCKDFKSLKNMVIQEGEKFQVLMESELDLRDILDQEDVPLDKGKALYYFQQSAIQGNQSAQFYLDNFHTIGVPPVSALVTRLLKHLESIFENTLPIKHTPTNRIDRKRLLKLAEKKVAQGHKQDDFNQQTYY